MAKKRQKRQRLSEQLREIIEDGPVSRYRIAKETGIDPGQLSRFIHGTGRLTTDSLDKVGECLRLRFVVEADSDE